MFVGMSIDYCLHLAHAYHQMLLQGRGEKLRAALVRLGPSIFGAACTTAVSTVFLLPCRVFLFVQLGTMMLANTMLSFIFAFLFLAPLLLVLGPSGFVGDIWNCNPVLLIAQCRATRASCHSRDAPRTHVEKPSSQVNDRVAFTPSKEESHFMNTVPNSSDTKEFSIVREACPFDQATCSAHKPQSQFETTGPSFSQSACANTTLPPHPYPDLMQTEPCNPLTRWGENEGKEELQVWSKTTGTWISVAAVYSEDSHESSVDSTLAPVTVEFVLPGLGSCRKTLRSDSGLLRVVDT